ncbi:MAG: GNAT family N-acetyltransferase [Dehalococcoidia bacterium]
MQTQAAQTSREELSLAQWRNSCELWRRQCAEPEAEGIFDLRELNPYLLVLQEGQSALPHLARLEHEADPEVEAFGAMYDAINESPREAAVSLRLHPSVDYSAWREFLLNLGFQPSTVRQIAMGRTLANVTPSSDTELSVDQVEALDTVGMAQAMECNGEAFGSPPEQRRFFLNPRTVDVYLARLEGIPAGSATAAYIDDTVGIYGVATRPGFRGRGVASALVARILQDASGRAELAVLDCQHELVSLYQRSGFEVAREMPTFTLLAARR